MLALNGTKKDFLTSCHSKEDLMPFLKSIWTDSKAYKKPFAVLVIDVDRFKSFNDKYGHLCGDEVLKYFSSSLRLSMSEAENFPFRFGGDEFVVVFPTKTSGEACNLAVKLAKTIKHRHFLLKGRRFKMSFSGGVAAYPGDGETVEEILDRADKAMYFSKRSGPGRITQYHKILFKKIRFFLFAVLIIGAGVLFLLYGESIFKFRFPGSFKMVTAVRIAISPVQEKELDRVYLKSGGILRGKIVREELGEVELKLKLDRGEGVMILKDSDIKNIERAQKSEPGIPVKE